MSGAIAAFGDYAFAQSNDSPDSIVDSEGCVVTPDGERQCGVRSPEYQLRLISLKCHSTASRTESDKIYLYVNNKFVGGPYIMKAGNEVNLNAVGEFPFNDIVSVELLYQSAVNLESLGLRRVSPTSLKALQFNRHRTANYTLNYEVVSSLSEF